MQTFKTTARLLVRQKRSSVINISGLAIGLAACLLISLYVQYELSFDAYNDKAPRIVRLTTLVHSPEADLAIESDDGPHAAAVDQILAALRARNLCEDT